MKKQFNNKIANILYEENYLVELEIFNCKEADTEVLKLKKENLCLHNDTIKEDQEDVELFKELTNGIISNS